MMHDCALTEEYFIFLDMPLCFEPEVRLRLGLFDFVPMSGCLGIKQLSRLSFRRSLSIKHVAT